MCAIGGALLFAAADYGKQVYDNYQRHAANIWTNNIDVGQIFTVGAIGSVAGLTLGGR